MAEEGTYLYGIARDLTSSALAGVAGVGGGAVRAVRHDDLSAVVSTVSLAEFGEAALRENLEDLDWLERVAREHHRVIDAATASAPTAPTRLAVIYRDDDRVRDVLRQRYDAFASALSRITGRVEWGVKAYVDPDRLAEAVAAETAPVEAAPADRPGIAYLNRRRAQQASRREASMAAAARGDQIDAALREEAEQTKRHAPQDPQLSGRPGLMVLNGAYLVPAARAERFAATVQLLRKEHPDVDIELTGPWAPYSFTEAPQ